MKTTKYVRRGKTITTLEHLNELDYLVPASSRSLPTINQAKRESRRLQMAADGALGRGSLMVG